MPVPRVVDRKTEELANTMANPSAPLLNNRSDAAKNIISDLQVVHWKAPNHKVILLRQTCSKKSAWS